MEGLPSLVLIAAPALFALLLRYLPVERRRVRLGAIIVATGMLPLLSLEATPHRLYLAGASLQFIFACEVLGRRGSPRSLLSCVRCLLAPNWSPMTPVFPDDILAVDRSRRSLLRGGAFAAGGIIVLALCTAAAQHRWFFPWARLAAGEPLAAVVEALGMWVWAIGWTGGKLFVDAGLLRLLGMPVRAPVDAPWEATNFLEYWRRSNVFRYGLLRDAYFRNFPGRAARGFPSASSASSSFRGSSTRCSRITRLSSGCDGRSTAS